MSVGSTNNGIWFADTKESGVTLILAWPEDPIIIQVIAKSRLKRGATFHVRTDRKERTIKEGGREWL